MRCWRILLASVILFSATANAEQCPDWVAKAVSIQGTVELRPSKVTKVSSNRWQTVKRGDTFCANDIVRVKSKSRAAIILANDTVLRLDQNSTVTFTNLSANKASNISLTEGIAHFISRVKQAFEVVTPFVNAAVEGTEFLVTANDQQSQVTVFEGKVRVSNDHGQVLLTKNKSAQAKRGQAPVININIKPRDVVQWALYYPAIVDTGSSTTSRKITSAASHLSLGRVGEALTDIEQVLKQNSQQPEALALSSIIALVNNNKEQALKLAKQAYNNNKNNVSAMLAMSYVHQAHFNIQAALDSLLNHADSDALIYARLAEVYLMLGNLDNAQLNAEKAVSLNPELAKSQSVLGFAYLAQVKIINAEKSFNQAIKLDQADPLSHLGLGLVYIRKGQLEAGRREIEYAASLDPNNALIRSYLGKAYYEEKRDKVAADQFVMAKELDPNDPTAWFYSAIQKQSTNRPVEALADLQQSVDLNDNRAVYRSRLLLDEDHAARSSGLARIYHDLGFEQLAQQQAFKSINHDFTNHSAHRFLAESYANRSRHELGRVSELLQSQLLAPINVSSIAPHLTETQLGIQPNAGPSGASFNQYDSLFSRNQSRLQLSALVGNNDTLGDEVVYSQLINNTSLSLGQYHYETEGFRANNDYEQDILNAFLHTNISPKQSIQFEVKNNETENGDLRLRFDPVNFSNSRRENLEEVTYRVGYHNKINTASRFIASVIKTDSLFNRVYTGEQSGLRVLDENRKEDIKSQTTELQYIYKQKEYFYIFGLGEYDYTNNRNGTITFTPPGIAIPLADEDRSLTNGYLYSRFNTGENLVVTLGLSHNSISDPIYETKQLNPKVGLNWSISADTQLRFAAFSTLKRPLKAEQTIEPTQIAGFNQFFDDPIAADAVNYGLSLEHHVNSKLFTGVELTKRDLEVPYINMSASKVLEEQVEYGHRFYIYNVLSNKITLSAEYEYEEFDRGRTDIVNQAKNLVTHKLPFRLKVNYLNGWSGSLAASYYSQDIAQVIETAPSTTAIVNSKADFWMTDLNISYHFEKRLGHINLEIRNLFDEDFKFYDAAFRATETSKPATLYHERSIWLRLALTFD